MAVYFLSTGINGLTMRGIPRWVTNVFNGGALVLAVSVMRFALGTRHPVDGGRPIL